MTIKKRSIIIKKKGLYHKSAPNLYSTMFYSGRIGLFTIGYNNRTLPKTAATNYSAQIHWLSTKPDSRPAFYLVQLRSTYLAHSCFEKI